MADSKLPPDIAAEPLPYEALARQAETRARQLAAVTEIARAATSSFDLDVMLRKSIELIRERLGFYHVSAFVVDLQTGEAVLRQATAGAGYALIAHEYQLKVGTEALVTTAIQTGQPCAVQDVTATPGYVPNPLLPETRSECVIPLLAGNKVLGVLEIKSNEAQAFGPEMTTLLQGVAALVAISVQNVRLYESEFARRLLAETLQEVGQLLGSTLNLDEVLRRLLGQLARAVPYDRAAVLLQNGDTLHMAAVRGFESAEQRAHQMHVPIRPGDLFSRIRETRKPLTLVEVPRKPTWLLQEWLPTNRFWVGAPLIVQDEVIGMISVARDRVGDYTPEEAANVLTFANQAAVAIHNARLYDQVTRFNQQLEQRVTERTAELERAYRRLEKLDRNKSDFINIVAHELRTPLTVLRGYTSLLKVDPTIQANAQLRDVITGMLNGAGRLHDIINRMLEAARVDSQVLDLHPKPMSLAMLLRRIYLELKPALGERSQTFQLGDLAALPNLLADDELLYKVFYNIIINAIKYTPDGGLIAVSGCVRELDGGKWVDVMVQDTGIGIAPEHHEVIFERFYQTGPVALHSSGKTKFKGGGAGLGLAIARSVVQAHNGRIWVESKSYDEVTCPGSTFHVLLPIITTT